MNRNLCRNQKLENWMHMLSTDHLMSRTPLGLEKDGRFRLLSPIQGRGAEEFNSLPSYLFKAKPWQFWSIQILNLSPITMSNAIPSIKET